MISQKRLNGWQDDKVQKGRHLGMEDLEVRVLDTWSLKGRTSSQVVGKYMCMTSYSETILRKGCGLRNCLSRGSID